MVTPKHCIEITTVASNSRMSSFAKVVPIIQLVFFFLRNTVLIFTFINVLSNVRIPPIPIFKRSIGSSKTLFNSDFIFTITTAVFNIEWKLIVWTFMAYLVYFIMILSDKALSKLYSQNAFEYFIILQYILDVHLVKQVFLFKIVLIVANYMWTEESENQFTAWLSDYCEIFIVIFSWFRTILQTVLIISYSSVFVLNTARTLIVCRMYLNLDFLITNQTIKIIHHLSFFV